MSFIWRSGTEVEGGRARIVGKPGEFVGVSNGRELWDTSGRGRDSELGVGRCRRNGIHQKWDERSLDSGVVE